MGGGFQNLHIRDAKFRPDASGPGILRVNDPHALIQAAGYLKYTCGINKENVFFRGQARHYGSLPPSIMRGGSSAASQNKRGKRLNRAIKDIIALSEILQKIPNDIVEPLLQHYGFNTSWVDLVDNIWVALWFSCHRATAIGQYGKYLHFEKRNQPRDNDTEFAYIYLIAADFGSKTAEGKWVGKNTELVDLRLGCPSLFVRPHAQHGVLFRMRGLQSGRPIDYSSQIRGVIEIELGQALSWLGDGDMLGVRALFPPPFYDQGYQWLLDTAYPGDNIVGTIAHVGA